MTGEQADGAVSALALARGAELRKELGVRDLVLAEILIIVGPTFVGVGGQLGPANLAYWLVASVLFFVPLVAVVLFLNRWAPLEGGLYQWAKLAFGPATGFLVAFNLWLTALVLLAPLGLDVVQALAYAFGRLAWMHDDPLAAPLASVVLLAGLAAASLGGLRFGKHVQNMGGWVRLGLYGMLIVMPLVALLFGRPLRAEAARIEAPPATLLGVNLLAKMGFGAFSGFEYVAIFAGESRSAEKSFARAVRIAAPLVVVMFVAGTGAVLAYVAPADIDLIAPLPQALGRATAGWGPAHLGAVVILLSIAALLGWGSLTLSGMTRLPMVAGWDGLLPEWFTRLSPRSRVPVNSILFVTVVTTALAIWGLSGVGHQEAYQLFSNAGMVAWALAYLVMFAIPIVGRGEGLPRPPGWLKVAAASGFVMTALFIAVSVVPVVHVEDAAAFGVKLTSIVLGANVVGAAVYLAGRRRRAVAVARASS